MSSREALGTVVISGASTGIGSACALALDQRGYRVFAGVRREPDGAALVAKASPQLTPLLLDVTDSDSIEKARARTADCVGASGIAGLINNAGIAVPGPIETVPLAEVRRQFEVNVVGQVAMVQAFLPLLRAGRGRVVNMSSIAGLSAMPFLGLYAASKFALEALTDALRLEVRPWGIEVVSIEPGAIATPIWERSAAHALAMERIVDPRTLALYREPIEQIRRVVGEAERRAIAPDAVASAVLLALTARRPRTRYLVGTDAKFRAWLKRLLSDRAQDWLLAKLLKLPPAP